MKYNMIKNLLFKTSALITVLFASSIASASPSDGEQVFNQWCLGCHMDSPFAPGTIFLKYERKVEQPVIVKRNDLNPAFVLHIVRNGKGGMPSFRNTEISATELTSLVKYLTDKK